ncbi:murein transglycosylase [Arthrobacter sp. Soil736]|uniref:lytic transglycosylase domain-containing protein n=1 Tax=Arthrobacter sp. Soil736 TaxID=1736395 RepID=UPI0006FAC71A|nr:lytic transglycosylase domain-containing protein [Arthrobacter sp. Soil736]KRE68656.1 murein transglycosylase [Arthrobacter sp. Soil736]
MLRLKRLAVLALFAFCVITGFTFWVLHVSGMQASGAHPPPPQSEAKLEVLSANSAVDITQATFDAQWLVRTAARTDIPVRALRAYAAAAGVANAAAPTCGIGWNTVAAIGLVESAHGTHGGGSLTAAGQAGRPIVGPSLDGDGFAAIPDTDDGALDGDALWDHAVGPMQFIPSTWQLAGRDGNGDGEADPLNIDDAALSAASYLCAGGRDLSTAQGWTDAIYSYNQSDSYMGQVSEQANAYAAQAGPASS